MALCSAGARRGVVSGIKPVTVRGLVVGCHGRHSHCPVNLQGFDTQHELLPPSEPGKRISNGTTAHPSILILMSLHIAKSLSVFFVNFVVYVSLFASVFGGICILILKMTQAPFLAIPAAFILFIAWILACLVVIVVVIVGMIKITAKAIAWIAGIRTTGHDSG